MYAARFQRFCHHHAFVKRPDQDGNIARNDRSVFEFQTTFGSFVERVGDFVGAIFGGTAAQDVFVEHFVVFAVEPAYLYGGLGRRKPAFGTCGADFGIVYAVQDERAVFAAEQCAYAVNQLGMAAVIGRQRVAVLRVGCGLQIGVNVGAAKAVNRLFRVAD